MDELIDQVNRDISAKTNEFQRFLLDNPSATASDPALQAKRQEIKLLQVKLQEYETLKADYEASSIPDKRTGLDDVTYTRPRNIVPVDMISTATPVGRTTMKVSK